MENKTPEEAARALLDVEKKRNDARDALIVAMKNAGTRSVEVDGVILTRYEASIREGVRIRYELE